MIINQIAGSNFKPVLQMITESGDYTIPYSGTYRICAIGHGAHGYGWIDSYNTVTASNGGAGGGGYLDIYLSSDTVLTSTITASVSSVAIGDNVLISATCGSGQTAGTVSGDGVIPFPSNGTKTGDVTPPDVYNLACYKSFGGLKGQYNDTVSTSRAGSGLFGGDGGDGGYYRYGGTGNYEHYGESTPPGYGAGEGVNGHPFYYLSSKSNISGSGGGGGFGGGGGQCTDFRFNREDDFADDDGGFGGAGCVRIERIK